VIISSVWGSVVHMTNRLREQIVLANPDIDVRFIDFEAFANEAELPDSDLIGPTAFALTETEANFFNVSFAIGVSTYTDDKNLFRMRAIIDQVFTRLRPLKSIPVYKAGTLELVGQMTVTDGTTLLPMSRAAARPWQYVQLECLLEPSSKFEG